MKTNHYIILATLCLVGAIAYILGRPSRHARFVHVARNPHIYTQPALEIQNTPEAAPVQNAPLQGKRKPLAASQIDQILDEKLGGSISQQERSIVEGNYVALVNAREKLELSIAQREELKQGRVLITIPEYYDKGENAYQDFVDANQTALGADRSTFILDKIEQDVRNLNFGFGAKEQNLLIESEGSSFKVSRGSGSSVKLFGNQPVLASATSVGSVRLDVPSSYTYLKPLFPQ